MNLPNKLSILRILMIPIFVVFYYLPFVWAPFVAVAVFILACFTDFLDGHIARKYNMVTDLGKLLDPIADKVLVCTALFCIVSTNPLQFTFLGPISLVFTAVCSSLILARELLISAVRQIAAGKGVVVQANIYGKIKTVMQDVCVPASILLNVLNYSYSSAIVDGICWFARFFAPVMFLLASLLTLISGVIYLVQNKKVFEND